MAFLFFVFFFFFFFGMRGPAVLYGKGASGASDWYKRQVGMVCLGDDISCNGMFV